VFIVNKKKQELTLTNNQTVDEKALFVRASGIIESRKSRAEHGKRIVATLSQQTEEDRNR